MDMDQAFAMKDMLLAWGKAYGYKLLVAILIIALGAWISRRISNVAKAGLNRRKVDPLLVGFIGNLVFYALMIAVMMAALSQVGIDTTSFLAIIGSLGLAIGLAVKDNLANFSSGVLLILFRPFTVGDYISVAGVAGTVETISLSNTILSTPDNQKIIVPNNKITGDIITNVTANDTRRVDFVIGIGYGDDMARAKQVVSDVIAAESRILPEPEVMIAVAELADSSVNLIARPWVKTEDYWAVKFDLTERIKEALDANGISIPYPQRDVHLIAPAVDQDS